MQVILASAKIMREASPRTGIIPSVPRFQAIAESFAKDLSRMTGNELSELFSCSPAIGEQNRQRYSVFGSDEAEVMPAVMAYNGQAYKHLKADTLTISDLEWANGHLWISSCLFGLLRPFDGINPYRMEGGFPLPSTDGKKVNEFWRPLLTDVLIDSVKADDGVLVYLDTEEFRSLFDWKRVVSQITVIEPEFHVLKGGKLTTPSVWAKTCRGAMARYIILVDEGKKLFLTHGHVFNEQNLPAVGFDAFVYGHSHLQKLERNESGKVICNTGSITFPKGGNPRTFVTYEGGVMRIRLMDGSIFKEIEV